MTNWRLLSHDEKQALLWTQRLSLIQLLKDFPRPENWIDGMSSAGWKLSVKIWIRTLDTVLADSEMNDADDGGDDDRGADNHD